MPDPSPADPTAGERARHPFGDFDVTVLSSLSDPRLARREDPRRFSLSLFGVRDTSPTLAALEAARRATGALRVRAAVLSTPDERGSTMPITSMDEVRGRMGDNFRRNLRKAGNRLAKEP